MFSLIIAIISIALVSALALASIYYGGEAFNTGKIEAEASKIINQGQQLQGAIAFSNVNGETVTTLNDLVDLGYISTLPTVDGHFWTDPVIGGDTEGYSTIGVTTETTQALCDKINEKAGITAPTTGSYEGIFGCDIGKNVYYKLGTFEDLNATSFD